jgi:hypothetical protein
MVWYGAAPTTHDEQERERSQKEGSGESLSHTNIQLVQPSVERIPKKIVAHSV